LAQLLLLHRLFLKDLLDQSHLLGLLHLLVQSDLLRR
jgi:hypothetical protein